MADTRGFFIFVAYAALVMGIALMLHRRAMRRLAESVEAAVRQTVEIELGQDAEHPPLAGFRI
jgi:hypothetical protein